MFKAGLRQLRNWMTKKRIPKPQENPEKERKITTQGKHLMNLRPGSEKMLIDTINKYGDIYRRDYDTC